MSNHLDFEQCLVRLYYIYPLQVATKIEDLGFSASVVEGEEMRSGQVELTITGHYNMSEMSFFHLIF